MLRKATATGKELDANKKVINKKTLANNRKRKNSFISEPDNEMSSDDELVNNNDTNDDKATMARENAESSNAEFLQKDDKDDDDDDNSGDDDNVFTQVKAQIKKELSKVTGETDRFNPHPDELKVQELRKGYARLIIEAKAKKSDLIKPEDTRLTTMLEDANDLMMHVHTTIDATLDSRFMALTADLGIEKVNKLANGTLDFNLNDFCRLVKGALMKNVTGEEENVMMESITSDAGGNVSSSVHRYNWNALGITAMKYWKGVTVPDFFLGPITVAIRERPLRNRLQREKKSVNEIIIQPTLIDSNSATSSSTVLGGAETSNNVIKVFQCLQRVAPIPFYKFIVDPTSYARTIENLFYISFLTNDNRIKLVPISKDGNSINATDGNAVHINGDELLIELLQDETDDFLNSDNVTIKAKHQAIYNMTMKIWRKAKEKYNLIKPIIIL